ncbi:hypothetical protein S83_059681, partial [Arachis hypogaea]
DDEVGVGLVKNKKVQDSNKITRDDDERFFYLCGGKSSEGIFVGAFLSVFDSN